MKKSLIAITCASSALALLLSACGGESSDTDGDSDGGSSSQTFSPSEGDGADDSPDEASSTFENGVLTTPDIRIEITQYKVIKAGQEGNEYGEEPVIAYWYNTTNVSGEETDPSIAWLLSFNAFQDNNPNAENELDVAALPDDKFLDSQSENIKQGGTVENAIAYELDDLVTPVDLVATDSFMGDVIGTSTYTLS